MSTISCETKCILVRFNGLRKGRESLVCGRVILVKREAYERRSPRLIPCFYSCPIRRGSKHQRRGSGTGRWKACSLRRKTTSAERPRFFGESPRIDFVSPIAVTREIIFRSFRHFASSFSHRPKRRNRPGLSSRPKIASASYRDSDFCEDVYG